MSIANVAALCGLLAVAGCEHPDPYVPAAVAATPPRTGMPRRITFNPEGDWWPVWLPDGSAIGYSYHPLERTDRDRCIAFIPPEGGRIMRQLCVKGSHETDSSNVVSAHVVSPGGRVALVVESGNPRNAFPEFRALYLGHFAGDSLTRAMPFPYLTPAGQIHLGASGMAWPNESTLVYLALWVSYRPAIVDIPPDTEYTGIELVQLRLRGDSVAARTVIPNTSGASSLAPGPPGTVYFTMGGDSRVFSLDVLTGQVATIYDFGALGIARDAQVAGGRLVAVVGGRVSWYFRPTWGIQAQADSGGPLYAVHLPSGAPVLIQPISGVPTLGSLTWRHLALEPSGQHVVAEASRIVERRLRLFTDTVVNKASDLWLFEVP